MEIILATRNVSKAEQIKEVFFGSPVRIKTLSEAGIAGDAAEDGSTLFENALKKARFVQAQTDGKVWTMADDTGLFIHALGGAPGVHSARWAGPGASTQDIMEYALSRLQGFADRSARFETDVVVLSPDGSGHFFSGSIEGTLLEAPRVPFQPQMPYSGLFVPKGQTRVLAEMSVEEENAVSHRGKAFRNVRLFLDHMARFS